MMTLKKMSVVLSATMLMLVLAACESGSAGSEAGASVDDLQDEFTALQEEFGALEDRVAELEGTVSAADPAVDAEDGIDAAADEAMFANPESYVGQQVTVSAEVDSVVDTHSFTLDGPDGPLLVVNATGSGESELVEDGSVVQVTGTVRESFSVMEVEQEFGLELDDGLYSDFEEQHYIAAESLSEPAAADS